MLPSCKVSSYNNKSLSNREVIFEEAKMRHLVEVQELRTWMATGQHEKLQSITVVGGMGLTDDDL